MDRLNKIALWEVLRNIADQYEDDCLCLAVDFNAIREPGERVGRSDDSGFSEMRQFDEFIRESKLVEIRTQGRRFTWYQPNGRCKSKLDRFFVNEKWLNVWPDTVGRGLQRSISDHCPISLTTKTVEWGPKPFRFINAWTTHPDFNSIVRKAWEETKLQGCGYFIFKEKLKALKIFLKEWNRKSFGNIDQGIQSLKEELHTLDIVDDTFGLEDREISRRNEIRANLILQAKMKISLLRQKAKANWIKEGDLNSKFYHSCIVGRRKKNALSGMFFENRWIEEPTAIKERVKQHFETFFRKAKRALPNLPPDFVTRRLSSEDKIQLIKPFTLEEIKEAIWSCDSNKSPGPDSFNLTFWKSYWETIKADLLQVLKEFHTHGKIPRGGNSSFIVLIPKKEEASTLDDFRPISFITSLYKVIAKILANRLRMVMDSIISDNQSAFIAEDSFLTE